jgi:hypothetical protein
VMLCNKFAEEQNCGLTAEQLVELSRLWKFEGNETIENAESMVAKIDQHNK